MDLCVNSNWGERMGENDFHIWAKREDWEVVKGKA
jgi:hypothetical protein